MDPVELLNFMRQKVGQAPVDVEVKEKYAEVAPDWITKEPKSILDGNELLDVGKNPLAELNKVIKGLQKGDVVVLLTDFRPEPLIEEMRKRGHEVYSSEEDGRHFTYILV